MSSDLLMALVAIETSPNCTTVENVTDKHVEDLIKSRSGFSVEDITVHVKHDLTYVIYKLASRTRRGRLYNISRMWPRYCDEIKLSMQRDTQLRP